MAKYQDVIIAGFGGQGVMLIGNLLAQAGMEHGLEVSFIPVYGAEMRGGTANCTVVLDEHPVGSPLVNTPRSIIVLNEPSLAKFQPRLHPDGVQIVNASLISEGLLDGKRATCFPSFASALANAIKVEDKVVTDDIFITAEGMGVSFAFGLALITVLYGEEKAEEIRISARAG